MRTTTAIIMKMKGTRENIPMLTAYDYSTAKVLDELEIPMVKTVFTIGIWTLNPGLSLRFFDGIHDASVVDLHQY